MPLISLDSAKKLRKKGGENKFSRLKQFIQEMPTKFSEHPFANQQPSSTSLGSIFHPTFSPNFLFKWTNYPYQCHWPNTKCWASVKDWPKKIHHQPRTEPPWASFRRCQALSIAFLHFAWSLLCLAWYSFEARMRVETPKLSLVDWTFALLLLSTDLWMLLLGGLFRIVIYFLCPHTCHKRSGILLETLYYSHTNSPNWTFIWFKNTLINEE